MRTRKAVVSLWLAILVTMPFTVLGNPGGGSSSGSFDAPRQMTPEDEAKSAYNRGARLVQQADKTAAAARAATDEKKKAKALDKARKQYASARDYFGAALQRKPEMHEAWNYVGYTSRKLGEYDKALTAYDEALRLNPAYNEAIEYRGEAYLGLNRHRGCEGGLHDPVQGCAPARGRADDGDAASGSRSVARTLQASRARTSMPLRNGSTNARTSHARRHRWRRTLRSRPGTEFVMRALARRVAIIFATSIACSVAAAASEDYTWRLPPGFPRPAVPADNPMSEVKVALGCNLFFDSRLSVTGAYSCASCHRLELAFTDGRARAIGATGSELTRGAMTLTNVAYSPALTWASDRVRSLEAQMEQPLFNEHPVELGLKRDEVALPPALMQDPRYTSAFRAAFPAEAAPASIANAIKAIAAFERTLISGRSPFDRYVFDDDRAALSDAAKRGMQLFFSERAGCSKCHSGLNFSGPIAHRGAPDVLAAFAQQRERIDSGDSSDAGLMAVTAKERDLGRFRVPTLRNIALTAPYMHDGQLATLEDVVEHYAAGGQRESRAAPMRIRPSASSISPSMNGVRWSSSCAA